MLRVNSQLLKVMREPLRGFTLTELLISFVIMGFLATAGIFTFKSYNENQILQSAVLDVVNLLNVARSRSLAQVKPTQCGAGILTGYSVKRSGNNYDLYVVCGGVEYILQNKQLPNDISFTAGSASEVQFSIGRTSVSSAVILNGFGKSKTITILPTGSISVD